MLPPAGMFTVCDSLHRVRAEEMVIHRPDEGTTEEVPVTLRIDTPIEIEYYRHGGILPLVLRHLLREGKPDPAVKVPAPRGG